jgi:hypothetical protein
MFAFPELYRSIHYFACASAENCFFVFYLEISPKCIPTYILGYIKIIIILRIKLQNIFAIIPVFGIPGLMI